ncbi:MAG: caspase family protein, partial [Bacteroidales bacterium]|nr:caspase family protein [Bacteroidales bacterium]
CVARFYRDGVVVPQNEARSNEWLLRYKKKGGKCVLPDFMAIYNEGLKHSENYAMNPNNNSVHSSPSAINSNNQTVNSSNQVVNNITVIQQVVSPQQKTPPNEQPIPESAKVEPKKEIAKKVKSDVDENIPNANCINENTFAWIFANENYQGVEPVPNAINDGMVFALYCEKVLGLPSTNIHLVKDATYNNFKREVNLMKQISEAYKSDANIIVYYAGHGLPDESSKNAFLFPVDGDGSDMTTCYSLNELYKTLGEMPASKIIVLLDACFSGSQRGDGMLAKARGVAIKAKAASPAGNMVVLSAAQGNETAYPYKEKQHGLFTYFLLKKLQMSKGIVTLGELFDYVKDNVVKKSLVVNGKQQTPSAIASSLVFDAWRSWTLE